MKRTEVRGERSRRTGGGKRDEERRQNKERRGKATYLILSRCYTYNIAVEIVIIEHRTDHQFPSEFNLAIN